jgi:hypothetical protein
MKKYSLVIAFTFVVNVIFCQENRYKNDIKAVYDTIDAATKRGDWDKVLEHTYAEIFKLAPREKMREMIAGTLSDTSVMKFNILKAEIDSFSRDSIVVDKELFILFYATNHLQFVIKVDPADSEEDHDFYLNMMKTSFEEQYGEENVTLDKAKRRFDVIKKKGLNLCANNSVNRDKNKWTILEIKLDNLPVMKQLLPDKVIDWIKKH